MIVAGMVARLSDRLPPTFYLFIYLFIYYYYVCFLEPKPPSATQRGKSFLGRPETRHPQDSRRRLICILFPSHVLFQNSRLDDEQKKEDESTMVQNARLK
jgi:hypothetical protein